MFQILLKPYDRLASGEKRFGMQVIDTVFFFLAADKLNMMPIVYIMKSCDGTWVCLAC